MGASRVRTGAALAAAVALCVAFASCDRAHPTTEPPQAVGSPLKPLPHPPSLFRQRSPSPIAKENRREGTRTWVLDRGARHEIAGFAAPISVQPGQHLFLHVRTRARSVRAEIYRLGWYGGLGGRLMASVGPVPVGAQGACKTLGVRFTVECPWRPTLDVRTSETWPSGEYLAKLIDDERSEAYVPFIVRELTPRAPILFVAAVTTWQAYNQFGGRSLYRGPSAAPCEVCATRSRAVSFDRPYKWPGSGGVFSGEFQMIELMEAHGLDVGYATSVDIDAGTAALQRRRVFVSAGHDEYYSRAMRNAIGNALAGGTSLAFLGANDMYRHIRFESSPLGIDRIEVNYKKVQEDPFFKTDPADATGNWRSPPTNWPEQAQLGAQYDCCPGSNHCVGDWFDWSPEGVPTWLFRHTGLARGVRVPRLIHGEYDRVYRTVPEPPGAVVVAHTTIPCGSHHMEQDSTFYKAPSGGGVFDAGDEFFTCAVGRTPPNGRCAAARVDPRIQQLVLNLLNAMDDRRFA